VYVVYPRSNYAARAQYMVGKLYLGLFQHSKNKHDLDASEEAFRAVVKKHRKSYLADDAQYKIGELFELYHHNLEQAYLEYLRVVRNFPQGDMKRSAQVHINHIASILQKKEKERKKKKSKTSKSRLVAVKGIRHWSSKDYTRVVIDLETVTAFEKRILPRDVKNHKPVRLCLDLENTYLPKSFEANIPIGDSFLRGVRLGQYTGRTVRVVLDTETLGQYNIFTLDNPFRIVVDVTGRTQVTGKKTKATMSKKPGKLPHATLIQQLALGIKRIVIDPGHGGKDTGAIGYHRILEKKVVLAIARRLKQEILKRHPHLQVILTRNKDRFIPLEERTAIANARKADLFISIHANAHRNRYITGVETYFLNFATDEEAVRVAARENATTRKRISDLQSILRDLMLNSKIAESSRLASCVQKKLVRRLRIRYKHVKNHGVKKAPFYVLVGAEMPSILVETSYISNPTEAKRLTSPRYQRQVAKGIADGVDLYIHEVHKLALGG